MAFADSSSELGLQELPGIVQASDADARKKAVRPREAYGPESPSAGTSFYVTVTLTVIEWTTLPEVPVIVTVYVFAGVGGFPVVPEQPATTIRSAAALASPRRVRTCRVTGKVKSSIRARISRTTWCSETGGVFLAGGGAIRPCVAMVTFPVPGAVTGLDGPVQLPCGMVPEQEIVTAPVNPPRPVTVTGIVPMLPAATEMGWALMVKSHAVPLRLTVCVVGIALSVMVRIAA
jgi:hypothetical protein